MNWHDAAIAIAICGLTWAAWGNLRDLLRRWREQQRRRVLFTFRSLEKMGVNEAGGMNPWGGVLVTDEPITAEQGEILRAAVERYRARCVLLPIDGQVFELVDGELVKR